MDSLPPAQGFALRAFRNNEAIYRESAAPSKDERKPYGKLGRSSLLGAADSRQERNLFSFFPNALMNGPLK